MWVWFEAFIPLLFDASLAVAVLTSIFLVLMLVSLQPARRIAMARTAIISSLLILPLTAFAPWPRFQLVQPSLRSTAIAPRQIFIRRSGASETRLKPKITEHDSIAIVPLIEDARPTHWHRLYELVRTPVRLIVMIYIIICGLGIIWACLGYLGIWLLLRRSYPPSSRTLEIFESLKETRRKDKSIVSDVQLRISERLMRPAVVSLYRPTILLPRRFDIEEFDVPEVERDGIESQVRLCLLHELAHVGRHDAFFQLIGSLAQALWFFLPQIWFIRSQLRLDQEFLADHLASRAYGTSSEYASSLLDLASPENSSSNDRRPKVCDPETHRRGGDRRPIMDIPAVAASCLGQRLLMLLHCPYRLEAGAPIRWLWGLRLTGAMSCLFLANVSIRPPVLTFVTARPTPEIERVFLAGLTHFQVSDLIVAPAETAVPCRSDSCVVPYKLPEHYSMTLDVFANQSSLSQIRLMDLPLAENDLWTDHADRVKRVGAAHQLSPSRDDDAHWHSVRIERDDYGISLTVDHHALHRPPQPNDSSLHFESPAGKSVELRNLIVTPAS